MNESAAALEGMSDTGQFELLATAVLRRAHPDCANLIHTGINAEGKPISSPIDGITLIPGSFPPRFVMIQHTTDARTRLRGKWLGTGEDIDKAAVLINQERQRVPESRLTLILTTNRVPNEDLFRDAHAHARSSDIDLDIWDRSRLSDFLDHTSDERPLLLIVDDINRSSRPAALLERLTAWSAAIRHSDNRTASKANAICILCPVWPQTLEQIPESVRRTVESCAVVHGSFSNSEAIEAVLSRAAIAEIALSRMRASEIGTALGNDPLLIAISSPETCAGLSAASVIPTFISQQIAACSASSQGSFIAGD